MQVMFTTIDGDLSHDESGSVRNGIEHLRFKSQHLEEDVEIKPVGPGDRITYLYRYTITAPTLYQLTACLRLKDCEWPVTRFARRTMRRDLWDITSRCRTS
jgi:hypothetical protein